MGDDETVAALLGRDPGGNFTVVVRRPDGAPLVIENEPFLRDGTPMPTRYWLVDPDLRARVSRLEAAGGVREAARQVDSARVAEGHHRYAAARDALIPAQWTGPRPSGGVGGTRQGIKCLHAHLAWYLTGGDDPVGRWTAEQIDLHENEIAMGNPTPGGGPGTVAAVDCGTNSTRLIVVAADGTVLDRQMHITRLGEGVDATRELSPAAIDRTLAVLRAFRGRMDDLGVGRVRAIATSAARDAGNADQFMAAGSDVLNVALETLSGDEEGRLSFAGATAHLPRQELHGAPVLVVDIGGGSTELTVGRPGPGRTTDPSQLATLSLDIGCVRVSERYLRHDPPTEDDLAEARAAVASQLRAAKVGLPGVGPDALMVGLAGTVSTLASLHLGVAVYDRARIHHAVLQRSIVEHWLDVLSKEDARTRLSHSGMVEGREDVIVGGIMVLAETMAVFERNECLASEDDILDGLAADLLHTG